MPLFSPFSLIARKSFKAFQSPRSNFVRSSLISTSSNTAQTLLVCCLMGCRFRWRFDDINDRIQHILIDLAILPSMTTTRFEHNCAWKFGNHKSGRGYQNGESQNKERSITSISWGDEQTVWVRELVDFGYNYYTRQDGKLRYQQKML